MTIKNAVVEKEAIKKLPSNTRMPALSKGPTISDELSNAVPKEPILTPTPANREGNSPSEDLIKDFANGAEVVLLRSDDEGSSAGSELSHGPKSGTIYHPSNRYPLKYADTNC